MIILGEIALVGCRGDASPQPYPTQHRPTFGSSALAMRTPEFQLDLRLSQTAQQPKT